MKSLGMARKVDDLGRIVLPAEMRRIFGIRSGDELEIAVEGSDIVLHKLEQRCSFCGNEEGLTEFHAKQICKSCRDELASSNSIA